jgi:RimJ/RimL family protein N-acetyltransferase
MNDPHNRAVHAAVDTPLGTATLRDLRVADIEAVVRYWHASGDEHLDALGIDRALLGSSDDTFERFRRAIRTGDADQRTVAFAIALDGALVGYTLLNRYTPEINHSHWHITAARCRGKGLSTALYPDRIKIYFDLTPMARLIHQTRTRNVGVNRMLDRFVPVAETRYVERPDGVAAPGEFHLRYVRRADVPSLFERAGRQR